MATEISRNFTDRRGKVAQFSYDGLNRRTSAGYGWNGTAYESTVSYTFDSGNRLTQAVDSISGTITRGYDGLDRLTSETTPQGSVSYTFDVAARRTSLTVSGQAVVNYTFDNANRLTQIAQGSSTVLLSYDAANRRTSLTLPNGVTTNYSYDSASELTALTYTLGGNTLGNLTYYYDLAGRRSSVGGSLAAVNLPTAVSSAGYNANNQLTTWGGSALSYDLNGNMTSDGTHSYNWDARNHLSQIDAGATGSLVHDAFGRRTSKTILGGQTGFLYDGVNPVQELSGTTVTANLLTGGVDEYFSRTDALGARHFLTDALGSTLALTDSAGTVQTGYAFEPFGSTTGSGATTTNSFAYTGRELDGTGLYYYRARYYNPTLQRFISEDPVGFHGGIDLYSYAYNSPTMFRDPTGLDGGSTVLVAGGTAATTGVSVTTTVTVVEIGSSSAPVFSLIAGGSAEGGSVGGPLGVAVGALAGLAVYDGYALHDLGVAEGWWPSSQSPQQKPPTTGRYSCGSGRSDDPGDSPCKQLYLAELESCYARFTGEDLRWCQRRAELNYERCLKGQEPLSPSNCSSILDPEKSKIRLKCVIREGVPRA
jgi:RHS repeat-associated protein